jgi:hypothetical protein
MKHIAVVVPTRAYTKNYFYANLRNMGCTDPFNPNILYNVPPTWCQLRRIFLGFLIGPSKSGVVVTGPTTNLEAVTQSLSSRE